MRSLTGMVLCLASGAAAAQVQAAAPAQLAQLALADLPAALYALSALIATAGGFALVWFAFTDAADEGFALRWQVGGFGGPSRGWRLSTPLARLIAGLTLVTLGVALALAQLPAKDLADPKAQTVKSPAASAAVSAAVSAAASAAVSAGAAASAASK